jgi:hypothetical protein
MRFALTRRRLRSPLRHRAIAANGAPSDGSIAGRLAPDAGETQRLAMKCAAGVLTAGHAGCGAFIGAA